MYLRHIYKTEDKELHKNKTFLRQQQNAYEHDKKNPLKNQGGWEGHIWTWFLKQQLYRS